MFPPFAGAWRDHAKHRCVRARLARVRVGRPLHREMTFTQAGLALGRGTILAEFGREGRAAGGLALDGTEARLLSLLTAAYREPVAGGVIEKIRRAGEIWRAGEKALAQIHLAFLGLSKIDETDAYRLFLAGTALEKGAGPGDLMKALGFPRARGTSKNIVPTSRGFPPGAGERAGNGPGAAQLTRMSRGPSIKSSCPTPIQPVSRRDNNMRRHLQTPVITPKTMNKNPQGPWSGRAGEIFRQGRILRRICDARGDSGPS